MKGQGAARGIACPDRLEPLTRLASYRPSSASTRAASSCTAATIGAMNWS